jgi:NADPH:quinone reductase-like Zn-dependent oxidoreductase
MGIVESSATTLGVECSGIVRKVGSKVKGIEIGDRVMATLHGCFTSRVVLSGSNCVKISDDLTFQDAATMPCVYATVIRSLIDVGRVNKGQVSSLP